MSNWLGEQEMQRNRSPQVQRGQASLPTHHGPQGPYAGDPGSVGERHGATTSAPPTPSKNRNEQYHRFAGVGVGLSSVMAEHVLSHPCIVLRRQCQVHNDSQCFHLVPFTLIPTIFNIQRHQSVSTLWKGIGSCLAVKGIGVATESLISEFTPLPREVNRHSSLKKLTQHLLLKSLTMVATTPFYAASLVETVQSEIASERPGVFDCLWEGMTRTMSMTTQQTTRLLPMWKLLLPNALHGLLHYVISSLAQYTVVISIRTELMENKPSSSSLEKSTERSIYETYYPELLATFTGNLLADTLLFPLETILHRLLLQGTRTIIDNTDSGLGVVPIITRYEGVMDCLKSIIAEEGLAGLYKGFGALLLQYGIHVAILKLAKLIFEKMASEAATPDRTIPLSDLQRMQQMQAQVRGQGQVSPHASPSKKGYSPQRVSFRGQSALRPEDQWQSPGYSGNANEYVATGPGQPRF